ncbi:Rap1a/Tai family immunity protein [Delftia acidovorans]|uniref:Rap1a/Tai family immunity protein n=1 Tax=Delftia acidovorans TaxID=80866 RepID=UPI00192B53CE|nr:Rap1a/Tai family immunity protein [Delftia acidovorans]
MTCIRAMVLRPISVLCLAWGLGRSVCAHADTRLTRPTADSQRLIIENNNLTAQAFFSAYMSKEVPERRYAEMYLLGVLDATEGRAWCDYRHLKTITLAEVLHSSLRSMDARQRATRAAHVITDILAKQFPCQTGPQ